MGYTCRRIEVDGEILCKEFGAAQDLDLLLVVFDADSTKDIAPQVRVKPIEVRESGSIMYTVGKFFKLVFLLARIIRNMIAEVRRLNGRKILIGECGHASRAAKTYVPNYNEGDEIPVVNCMELTLQLITEGRIELDPD